MQQPCIEVKGLNFNYPDGTKALEDLNLEIEAGRTYGLIGPNGAGKSTFLLHVNGILSGRGAISVFGLPVLEKNLTSIRSQVGLVFQDPDSQLFMPTVFDDVAFGPLNMGMPVDKVREAVVRALEEVDMLPAIKRSSHHLSFGEKKRICLATVLSMSPKVLLLDEPTANLDPKHRRQLIRLLERLRITKVIATHDLELVGELCSRVILLDQGRLIVEETADTVLSNTALLEAHGLEMSVCPGRERSGVLPDRERFSPA
ncbi:MAG: ABC transporter ATP-binding protein [Candidatus Omnitrophica bacterium]|nr:ABC transporter ATP-binding protein [Candidatus Omnitrophota bacterium]